MPQKGKSKMTWKGKSRYDAEREIEICRGKDNEKKGTIK